MIYISVLAGLFTIFLYAYSTVLLDYFLIQDVRVLTPTFFILREWIQRTLDVFGNAVTGRKSDIIAFIDTIEETTSESFMADYKRIKDELTPLFGEFRIRDHIAQYFEKLGPIMTQVMAEYRAATDSLIPRVEPQVEELKEIFKVNAWDTKEKLMPILNVFQRELTLAYNKVKEMGRMYGEEYKEHMDSVVERLRSINPENIAAKRPEINKLGNEILEKFIQLQQLVTGEGN